MQFIGTKRKDKTGLEYWGVGRENYYEVGITKDFEKLKKHLIAREAKFTCGGNKSGKTRWLIHAGKLYKEIKGKESFYAYGTIFSAVKTNVKSFLAKNPVPVSPVRFNVVRDNPEWDLERNYTPKVVDYHQRNAYMLTDITAAYWVVAWRLGYISKKTFQRGVKSDENLKIIRNAALATLGSPKFAHVYKDGESIKTITLRESDKDLQDVYTHIRYTTYRIMLHLQKLTKGKWFRVEVDEVQYFYCPEALNRIASFLDEIGIPHWTQFLEPNLAAIDLEDKIDRSDFLGVEHGDALYSGDRGEDLIRCDINQVKTFGKDWLPDYLPE